MKKTEKKCENQVADSKESRKGSWRDHLLVIIHWLAVIACVVLISACCVLEGPKDAGGEHVKDVTRSCNYDELRTNTESAAKEVEAAKSIKCPEASSFYAEGCLGTGMNDADLEKVNTNKTEATSLPTKHLVDMAKAMVMQASANSCR